MRCYSGSTRLHARQLFDGAFQRFSSRFSTHHRMFLMQHATLCPIPAPPSCAGARHPASHGGDLAKPALRLPRRRPMDDSTNSWEWQFNLMHAYSGLGSSYWLHAWLESRKSEISFKHLPVRKLTSGENAGQPDLSLHRSLDDGALACPSTYAQQCSPARAKDLARQGNRWCLSTNYPCLLGQQLWLHTTPLSNIETSSPRPPLPPTMSQPCSPPLSQMLSF